jgi:hypothetical protein
MVIWLCLSSDAFCPSSIPFLKDIVNIELVTAPLTPSNTLATTCVS